MNTKKSLESYRNTKISLDYIEEKCQTDFIGNKIIHFETIGSTNNYAKLVGKEVVEGTIIISEEQTLGKGRLGRKWSSNKGEGIWMSIILKPDIPIEKAPFITMIAGASILKSLNELEIDANIKWPNDIIIKDKKLAGILTELSVSDNKIEYIVLGIGMNVNTKKFDKEIENIATSLFLEGYNLSREQIILSIIKNFEELYVEYIKFDNKEKIIDIHKKYSVIMNKEIYVVNSNENRLVKCIDINEDGSLVIINENQIIEEISSGEVSIRGVKGYV